MTLGGTHSLEGTCLLWPALPGKFLLQPNSVSEISSSTGEQGPNFTNIIHKAPPQAACPASDHQGMQTAAQQHPAPMNTRRNYEAVRPHESTGQERTRRKPRSSNAKEGGLLPARNSPSVGTFKKGFLGEAEFGEKGFSQVEEEKTKAGERFVPGTPGVGVKRQGVESPVSFLETTVPPACKSSVVTNTLNVPGARCAPTGGVQVTAWRVRGAPGGVRGSAGWTPEWVWTWARSHLGRSPRWITGSLRGRLHFRLSID